MSVSIGRRDGKQAMCQSGSNRCGGYEVLICLPQITAMLVSVTVHTIDGAKFQSKSGDFRSTSTKVTRRTIEMMMTLPIS